MTIKGKEMQMIGISDSGNTYGTKRVEKKSSDIKFLSW